MRHSVDACIFITTYHVRLYYHHMNSLRPVVLTANFNQHMTIIKMDPHSCVGPQSPPPSATLPQADKLMACSWIAVAGCCPPATNTTVIVMGLGPGGKGHSTFNSNVLLGYEAVYWPNMSYYIFECLITSFDQQYRSLSASDGCLQASMFWMSLKASMALMPQPYFS